MVPIWGNVPICAFATSSAKMTFDDIVGSNSFKKYVEVHRFFKLVNMFLIIYSRPENLIKSRQKNSWKQINQIFFSREIALLAVLNFFPVQKLSFGHFWNCKKWNLVKKKFWNWFIWFHDFFCPGLF